MNPEQIELYNHLTPLQQRAATFHLQGMTQLAAYTKAGSKAKGKESLENCASQLFRKPRVAAFLQSMRVQSANQAVMDKDEALLLLSALARTSMVDLVEFASDGRSGEDDEGNDLRQSVWQIKDSAMQDPHKMASIAELTAGKEGLKIKQHSRLQAVKQLAELQGWNAPIRGELTGAGGLPLVPQACDLSDEQLAAIVAGGGNGHTAV